MSYKKEDKIREEAVEVLNAYIIVIELISEKFGFGVCYL